MELMVKEYLEELDIEQNNYKIINKKCVDYRDNYWIALVLFNDKEYVTYGYMPSRKSFFWGHYYKKYEDALNDFRERW